MTDLRGVANVTPDIKALNEADCVNTIPARYIETGEYKDSVRFSCEGVEVLEEQFGTDSS